jgi:hypothetical protein
MRYNPAVACGAVLHCKPGIAETIVHFPQLPFGWLRHRNAAVGCCTLAMPIASIADIENPFGASLAVYRLASREPRLSRLAQRL